VNYLDCVPSYNIQFSYANNVVNLLKIVYYLLTKAVDKMK